MVFVFAVLLLLIENFILKCSWKSKKDKWNFFLWNRELMPFELSACIIIYLDVPFVSYAFILLVLLSWDILPMFIRFGVLVPANSMHGFIFFFFKNYYFKFLSLLESLEGFECIFKLNNSSEVLNLLFLLSAMSFTFSYH